MLLLQGVDPIMDDDDMELEGTWQFLEMLAYNMGLPIETARAWARERALMQSNNADASENEVTVATSRHF